jgi:hypothetical protein
MLDTSTADGGRDGTLLITTENRRGVVFRWSTRVLFGLMAVATFGVLAASREARWNEQAMYPMDPVLLQGLMVFMGVALAFAACVGPNYPRGAWRLSAEGVEFQPLRGTGKYLAWSDVEAASWGPELIRLRGAGTVIRLHLWYAPSSVQSAARAIVENRLDPRVLPPPAASATAVTVRRWMRRIAKKSLIPLSIIAIFVVGIALLGHFDPSDEWVAARRSWVIVSWFGLLAWWVLTLRKMERESWRSRRAPSP